MNHAADDVHELTGYTDDSAFEFDWLRKIALIVAAFAIGCAIHVRDGEYTPGALGWVTAGVVACAWGVLGPRGPRMRWGEWAVTGVLAAGLLAQFAMLYFSPAGGWNEWSDDVRDKRPENLRFYYWGVVLAAGVSLVVIFDSSLARMRRFVVPLLLATHVFLGVWMIRSSPQPHIDVYEFQQAGPAALLSGQNPYAITFPDIYESTKPGARPVYGDGLSEAGELQFGFPYMPLSLLMATAGYAAAGDHRYAQLVAMTLGGAFMAYARPTRTAALAAALFLFTPRAFFVLGRGWTEPFLVCLLALTVLCACRGWRRRALPVALGLFLASKQYLIFAVPLIPLLAGRRDEGAWRIDWREAGRLLIGGLLVAALATVPIALWDPTAFIHSTFAVQKVAPFRSDALSYLVWLRERTGMEAGAWVAFAAAPLGTTLCLWRAPRGPAGYAGAVALVYVLFISTNKQAFANYYLFVIGATCCALAGVLPRPATEFLDRRS